MISIIIPVYNGENVLRCCLDSIILQTYKNIEIILVNDASTDKTMEIAKEYIDQLQLEGISYKIMNHENNSGAPTSRNHGFQAAKGEYVLFCDADSVLEKECLYEMVSVLENNPTASYVYSSFYWGKKIFKLWPFDAKKLRQMPYIHTTSLIRTRDFPKTGWDEEVRKLQDWDLWLTFLDEGKVGIFIDKVLFHICPGGTISSWLPSIAYKIAPFLPAVKKYKTALRMVKEKHGLILPEEERMIKRK